MRVYFEYMNKLIAAFVIGSVGLIGVMPAYAAKVRVQKKRTLSIMENRLVGSYRCSSYNVSGGGGANCRLTPPIVFSPDGSYRMSSEKGTFKVLKGKVVLSASKLRGPGTVSTDARSVRFSYTYRGWKHVVTYLREGKASRGSVADAPTKLVDTEQTKETESVPQIPRTIPVELLLNFAEADASPDWINVIMLVPQGSTPETSSYRAEALAVLAGRHALTASFTDRKEINTGAIYDIYTSSGFETLKIGSVDLRTPTALVKQTFTVTQPNTPVEPTAPSAATSSPVQQPAPAQVSTSPQQTAPQTAAPCNPNVPRYAGGC